MLTWGGNSSVLIDTRTRGVSASSAKCKRQNFLKILRRRRARERTGSQTPDNSDTHVKSEPNVSHGQPNDHDDAAAQLSAADSEAGSAVSSLEDLDHYEADFVLEDDEVPLGVPSGLDDELPFEFSRHRYKKPKEYFRDAVEWMVHNKLNPAFPRTDPVYQVAFTKLEDEVKGRAGSQLVSTVWNSNFVKALLARPRIQIVPFPLSEHHPCDACNRSNHPASSEIQLQGRPYSLDTLEPLSDDSDDSDDRESAEQGNRHERDRDGNILRDETIPWRLGRWVIHQFFSFDILSYPNNRACLLRLWSRHACLSGW